MQSCHVSAHRRELRQRQRRQRHVVLEERRHAPQLLVRYLPAVPRIMRARARSIMRARARAEIGCAIKPALALPHELEHLQRLVQRPDLSMASRISAQSRSATADLHRRSALLNARKATVRREWDVRAETQRAGSEASARACTGVRRGRAVRSGLVRALGRGGRRSRLQEYSGRPAVCTVAFPPLVASSVLSLFFRSWACEGHVFEREGPDCPVRVGTRARARIGVRIRTCMCPRACTSV